MNMKAMRTEITKKDDNKIVDVHNNVYGEEV